MVASIPLTLDCRCAEQRATVIIDAQDYEWARQWKWHITWDKHRRKDVCDPQYLGEER